MLLRPEKRQSYCTLIMEIKIEEDERMAKLNGVKTLDMVNGEITKVAYDGAEYGKVDGITNASEVKEGDIGLTGSEFYGGDISKNEYYEMSTYNDASDKWLKIKEDNEGDENGLKYTHLSIFRAEV